MTRSVVIHEVGPRDGLQNEAVTVETRDKLALIEALCDCGLPRVEVTSFVSPRWIPQLADAEAVAAALPTRDGVEYSALVPNVQGFERFCASGQLHQAAVFISVSETHNRKNVNRSVAEHLSRLGEVMDRAAAAELPVRAYVSTAFGCPDEGEVATAAVVDLARRLVERGASEISVGDTIGIGTPRQVREVVAALAGEVPLERVALHFHDTWGRALANVEAGVEAGVRIFDASVGGLGGCPYAPGASGNLATEDLVDLLERSGIDTGVDLDRLVDTVRWLEEEVLKRSLPGRVARAVLGQRARAARA